MILQHNTSLTVGDYTDITEATQSLTVFRVGDAVSKSTSQTGETASLYLAANDTKSIALPLGYTTANILRLVGTTSGTIKIVMTHPTLGAQTLIIKGGGISICSRVSSLSLTEMAGSATSFSWSIMQISASNSEDFQ
jgi:hypothetical protein